VQSGWYFVEFFSLCLIFCLDMYWWAGIYQEEFIKVPKDFQDVYVIWDGWGTSLCW